MPDNLFDYSALHEVPDVEQRDLPRYIPKRGASQRITDITQNQNIRDKVAEIIQAGVRMGGPSWYNVEPLRREFIHHLGADEGNRRFRKYMDFVAATSPRSAVPENVRNASYYYHRAVTGQGMPEVGERNPQPYGHMAQRLHQMNAQRVSGEGWDALNNPKPASFVENLVGNQRPGTMDTHAFRLPAILAADPRFLARSFKNAKDEPPRNIQKEVESGQMSMEDALKQGALWESAPNDNEYAALEHFYRGIGHDLGLSTAQSQASAWVAGGKHTGLGSDESKPFLRFLEDRIHMTAKKRNMDPRDVLKEFIHGRMPLFANGGAAVQADHLVNKALSLC